MGILRRDVGIPPYGFLFHGRAHTQVRPYNSSTKKSTPERGRFFSGDF